MTKLKLSFNVTCLIKTPNVEVAQYLSLNDFCCEMLRLLEAEASLRDLYLLFEEPDLKEDTHGPRHCVCGTHGQLRERT